MSRTVSAALLYLVIALKPADADPSAFSSAYVGISIGHETLRPSGHVTSGGSPWTILAAALPGVMPGYDLSSTSAALGFLAGWIVPTERGYLGFESDINIARNEANSGRTTGVPLLVFPGGGGYFAGTYAGSNSVATASVDWYATLRIRAGIRPSAQTLLYATAGVATGGVSASINGYDTFLNGGYSAHERSVRIGWAFGGGGEIELSRQWSARAEYMIVDLGRSHLTATGADRRFGPSHEFHWIKHVARAAIIYRIR